MTHRDLTTHRHEKTDQPPKTGPNVLFVKIKRFLIDLADGQWFIAQHLIPAAKPGGRPRSLDMRLVVNAIHFGRHKHPTAGSIDRQAVKTGHTPAHVRSYLERTFAWLGLNRRLCNDYERLPTSRAAFIHIAMIRLMARRLAPDLPFSNIFEVSLLRDSVSRPRESCLYPASGRSVSSW